MTDSDETTDACVDAASAVTGERVDPGPRARAMVRENADIDNHMHTRGAASIDGFRSETVETDGVRPHCRLGGDTRGRPIMLWHGFLSTGYAWRQPMIEATSTPISAIPSDDPDRRRSVVDPDDPNLGHVAIAGDTYTILLSGAQTNGRCTLIDMNGPRCGGPGPHRHDFEEMFHVLDGEIEFTFRGEKIRVEAGTTVNIPANAPHFFTNIEDRRARMLCMCPGGESGGAGARAERSRREGAVHRDVSLLLEEDTVRSDARATQKKRGWLTPAPRHGGGP